MKKKSGAGQDNVQRRWFSRHPGIIFLIFMLILAFLFEMACRRFFPDERKVSKFTETRYLKLFNDNTDRELIYDADDVAKYVKMNKAAVPGTLEEKEYRIRWDKNGFILPSGSENPDVTVLFLGGSTTECMYVDENSRFPYLSGRLISEKTGLAMRTLNGGGSGRNSMHSNLYLIAAGVPEKPDIAVMMHVANDLSQLLYAADNDYWTLKTFHEMLSRDMVVRNSERPFSLKKSLEGIAQNTIPGITGFLTKVKNKLDKLNKRKQDYVPDDFSGWRKNAATADPELIKQSFRKSIKTFVGLCRANGITPVLMTQFNNINMSVEEKYRPKKMEKYFSWEKYCKAYKEMSNIVRDVAKEEGVLLIDLAEKVPSSGGYMYDLAHLNTKGSEFVAGIVAEGLEPLVKEIADAKKNP